MNGSYSGKRERTAALACLLHQDLRAEARPPYLPQGKPSLLELSGPIAIRSEVRTRVASAPQLSVGYHCLHAELRRGVASISEHGDVVADVDELERMDAVISMD